MKFGDESELAASVRKMRLQRAMSQAELAEAARVSTKTIQRLEAGEPIAGSSRRSVLGALGIDPAPLFGVTNDETPLGLWERVVNARSLLERVTSAKTVEVELDRDGWLRSWRERPWHRMELVFATFDPIDVILDCVDRAAELQELPPGRAARRVDELATALRGASKLRWALATKLAPSGHLTLFMSSEKAVTQKLAH